MLPLDVSLLPFLAESFVPQTDKPRKKILVVEDDPHTRAALRILLATLGYEVIQAATVAEGLASLDGQHRAILDLNLPDGLGTEVLARIRSDGRPIRVAITTASADEALIGEARRLDAELILRKPIDVNALIAWLERDG